MRPSDLSSLSEFYVEFPYCRVTYQNTGLVITEFYNNRIITSRECEQLLQLITTHFPNEKLRFLISAGPNTYFDQSARRYSASDAGTKHSLAEAYVVSSFVQHIIGWIYLLFNRPKVKTKLFRQKQKAVTWLESIG